MMTKDADKKREQMMMFSMDDMVPKDHMLRKIDRAINWNFIYDLVEDKYCTDNGRPSMDPVMLIKIPFIQYLYGIRSMRQTIKEIEVNVAYRWFLGLDMLDQVPHFSTFGKNYTRRFKDTGLFEQIFSHILEECMKFHLVDTSVLTLFLVILLFFLVFFFFSPVPTAELLISLVPTLNSCFIRWFSLFHQLSLKLS